jgi:hypothetical protein
MRSYFCVVPNQRLQSNCLQGRRVAPQLDPFNDDGGYPISKRAVASQTLGD